MSSIFSSSIVILELDSAAGQQPRQLTLKGPSLPFMGAGWGSKQVVITTWYQGNGDEATQQVLGPQETPTRFSGEWRRTMLGKAPAQYSDEVGHIDDVIDPQVLRDALETIMRGGMLVRVTWAVQGSDDNDPTSSGKIVREGRIVSCEFKHTRIQDIAWEAEFAWKSRGAVAPRVSSVRGNTVNSDSAQYVNKLNALLAAAQAAQLQKFNPSALTLGQLEAVANYPTTVANALAQNVQQITSSVGQLVDIATTLASQPVQVANRAVDLAQNTVYQTNNFKDELGEIPYESQTTKTKVADLIQSALSFATQSDLAQDAARAGEEFAQKLQQQYQSTANKGTNDPGTLADPESVQQVYITKSGDTPQRVSVRYYQTPDHAADILRANRLPWHLPVFPSGKILIIPALNTFQSNPIQGV